MALWKRRSKMNFQTVKSFNEPCFRQCKNPSFSGRFQYFVSPNLSFIRLLNWSNRPCAEIWYPSWWCQIVFPFRQIPSERSRTIPWQVHFYKYVRLLAHYPWDSETVRCNLFLPVGRIAEVKYKKPLPRKNWRLIEVYPLTLTGDIAL